MFYSALFQSFLVFILITLSCSQVGAKDEKGNLSNDVILKTPRRTQKPAQSDIMLKKAEFKSKNSHLNGLQKGYIQTPSGQRIKIYLALSDRNQSQGLSGVRAKEFSDDEGMLFFNTNYQPRSFWMPNTYFNLDIFFLNKDLRVANVERNVPHHPGMSEPPAIYRTNTYKCWHVLELKHSSLSKQIVSGSKLIWTSSPDLTQIELNIRRGR